jgi:hypothetical protein
MAYQVTTPPAFLEPFGEKLSDANNCNKLVKNQ